MMNDMMMQKEYVSSGAEPEPVTQCNACQSITLIEDNETGEVICANCGLVITERAVSLKQDWRSFTLVEHNERSRNGYALSNKIFDQGLSTTFINSHDSNGKKLDPETKELMKRLKKQDQRSKVNESWQRNLKIALSEMSRICTELHLPDHVHEKSAQIYRKILKDDLVRGRSIDGFVSASIYAACRLYKLPRSINDVAEASSQSDHEVKYYYRLLVKELDFKPPIDHPTKFISSLASKLKLHGPVEEKSMRILTMAREQKLVTGKNPRGVAAAILYLACKETGIKISQSEVARVANTSEVTMRKRFKEYEPIMETLAFN
jgi:transcription initiation factor TFIIB